MAINADQNNMLIDPVNHPEPDSEAECDKDLFDGFDELEVGDDDSISSLVPACSNQRDVEQS